MSWPRIYLLTSNSLKFGLGLELVDCGCKNLQFYFLCWGLAIHFGICTDA